MPKMFANPTYDTAFKRLFGSSNHADLTKNFLNVILNRAPEHWIEEIVFVNTEKTPRFKQEKKTYIDIQCKDKSGHEFIIEMQSTKEDFFTKRAQYYVAHALSRQLEKKGFYTQCKPVIFIGVLGFHAFESEPNAPKNNDVITHHLITNQATQKQDLDLMEFHFIELPKFKKTEKELTTEADRWLYFFKKAGELDEIPKSCAKSATIKEAFEIMERANWQMKDWEIYEEERKLQIYFATQAHVEEQKKLEAERIQQAAERITLEAEKKSQEAEKTILEAEKKSQEAEKNILEAEKKSQEAEKTILEAEKKSQEAKKNILQAEKNILEAEKKSQEAEKKAQEIIACNLLQEGMEINFVIKMTGLSKIEIERLCTKK